MARIQPLREIPRGMVSWVRSVEAAVRELTTNLQSLTNLTLQKFATYQINTPIQLMQSDEVQGTLTAAESQMALQPTWSNLPNILITNTGVYTTDGVAIPQSILTLGATELQFMPIGGIKIGYLSVTGGSPNMYRDPSSGYLSLTSSSLRYKQDVQDADEAILIGVLDGFRPRIFRMIGEVEKQGDDAPWYYGGIAEELDLIEGSKPFVDYLTREDAEGNKETLPDGIRYANLVVPLIVGYRKLRDEHTALEQRVAALEAQVAALTAATTTSTEATSGNN